MNGCLDILNNGEIKSLIQSYKEKKFFKNAALHKERFQHLITWDVINSFLNEHRFNYGRVKLYKQNEIVDPYDYIHQVCFKNQTVSYLDASKVNTYIKEGFSLIIDAVNELHAPLKEMVHYFENLFQNRVTVNAYLSFKEVEAFLPHWDDHDVFILQVYGKKKWYLTPNNSSFPLSDNSNELSNKPKKFKIKFISNEGDIFYIPRGMWHYAVADNGVSVHLTFGIKNDTGADFLEWIAKKAKENLFFRKDVPKIHHNSIKIQYYREFIKEVSLLLKQEILDEYLEFKKNELKIKDSFTLPNID